MRLWWITGGGSGIGRALARQVAARGDRVVISGRRIEALRETAIGNANIIPLILDITDPISVTSAVIEIETIHGSIDVAVLNAGLYRAMDLGDFDGGLFQQTIATNVLGVVSCLDPLFKRMRLRRKGQIAIVASVAGYRGLPNAAAYGASKAALINMAQSLKPSCDKAGIKLQVINPGFVETPMTATNRFPMPFLIDADKAAGRILSGLDGSRFEIAFPWIFVLLLKIGRLLPDWLYFAITRRMI